MADKAIKNVGGRPPLEIDFTKLEGMMQICATAEECAAAFWMSLDTLDRKCKEHYGRGFADTARHYQTDMKTSLRRKQLQLALKGDGHAPMLVWLGKQVLGQADKQEMTMTDVKPIKLQYALDEPKEPTYIDTEVVHDSNQIDKTAK